MRFARPQPLLEVTDLNAGHYPGQNILKGISLTVAEGEVVCVIGPNGAGKSTVFKTIYRLIPVSSGHVTCRGRDITNINPQQALEQAGITIVPQLRSVLLVKQQHVTLLPHPRWHGFSVVNVWISNREPFRPETSQRQHFSILLRLKFLLLTQPLRRSNSCDAGL